MDVAVALKMNAKLFATLSEVAAMDQAMADARAEFEAKKHELKLKESHGSPGG